MSAQISLPLGAAGVSLVLELPDDGPVLVRGVLDPATAAEPSRSRATRLVELATDGGGHDEVTIHTEHRSYRAGLRLRLVDHRTEDVPAGQRLTVTQRDPDGLEVVTVLEAVDHAEKLGGFPTGGAVLHASSTVRNTGTAPVVLRYVSSLSLTGFVGAGNDVRAAWESGRVHVGYNGWAGEFRWRALPLQDIGLVAIGYPGGHGLRSRYAVTGRGSWSSGDQLPMGGLSRTDSDVGWAWQVENNGPWHWELSDAEPDLELRASGPTRVEHEWSVRLAAGEEFGTVPVAIARSEGGFEGALQALTRHRRRIRRPHPDTERLPVIVNDYMNALMGDPTTAKLLPLIDAAADAGAEYFVVDAGWYTDEPGWWDLVGAWETATDRFPNGFGEVVDAITGHGMVPGIWLEPEVVGVRSPIADSLPAEAFMRRDGVRVVEYERYQLDLRHPAARAHLDATVDRLVGDFGIGYFKLDHNINIGAGSEVDAFTPGEALLDHVRALSDWHDGILDRHPGLVVENCSSGGMRVDYGQLARLPIQSTSDQQDPVLTSAIAAAAPSALTPEQAAVWAYPQPGMDGELLDLTMINALLGRIHLSGGLDKVTPQQRDAVKAAVAVYRGIREHLPQSVPSWPLGLPGWYDDELALALETSDRTLLAVWRRGGTATEVSVPLPRWRGTEVDVALLHPSSGDLPTWDPAAGLLTVALPTAPAARLVQLTAPA